MKSTSVLFVCLGNICRSPTADGVLQTMVSQEGMNDQVEVDSAGTSGWHIGEPPDSRTTQAAKARGYELSTLRGRQVEQKDFLRFDYILAMDQSNLDELHQLRPSDYEGHLGLFLEFGQQQDYREVPDPYYGGAKGFDLVLDLVEDACRGLLMHIKNR